MKGLRGLVKSADNFAKRFLGERQYALLVEIVCRLLPQYVPLRVRPLTNGIGYQVSDGMAQIDIVTAKRAFLYRKGIQKRLNYLAERYTLRDFVSVHPGEILLDIGANIGEFSLAYGDKIDRCTAVEPDPLASQCLENNLNRWRVKYIYHQAVLWNEEEELVFRLDSKTADSSIDYGAHPSGNGVRATTLDSLLGAEDAPSFIKMDVEGAEPEVIQGGRAVFAAARSVAIDCGPERNSKSTDAEVVALLRELGFDVRIRDYVVFARKL